MPRQRERTAIAGAVFGIAAALAPAGCRQTASAPPVAPAASAGAAAASHNIGMQIQKIASDPRVPESQKAAMIAALSSARRAPGH